MTAHFDHNELRELAANTSYQARDELLEAVVNYFCNHPAEPSAESCAIFCEIVQCLLEKTSPEMREHCMGLLAVHSRTPDVLAIELAKSDKPEVFMPFLARSAALKDAALCDVSEKMTNRHRLAIARRSQISETVSASLVKNGDNEVLRTLAGNPGAEFSQDTTSAVLQRAGADAELRKTIKKRGEKSGGFFKQLRSAVSSLLAFDRTDFGEDDFTVDELDSYVDQIEEARVQDEQCEQKIDTVDKKIVKKEMTLEEALNAYSEAGQVREIVALLAKRLKLPVNAVRTVYTQKDPTGFSMLCYALKLDQQTFRNIVKNRLNYLNMDSSHISVAADAYRKVTTNDCDRFVRILRQSA